MKHRLALVLLGTASLCSPALAASSGTASLSGFSFRLADLDASDGVDSSLKFAPGASGGSSVSTAALDHKLATVSATANGSGPSQPVVSSTMGVSTSTANFGGFLVDSSSGALLGLADMAVSGTADGLGRYEAKATASSLDAALQPQLLLSPHTSVTFSALASITAATTAGTPEDAYSIINWSLKPQFQPVPPGASDALNTRVWLGAPDARAFARDMTLTLSNTTANPMRVVFSAEVLTSGVGTVAAPVPEPETYAMMLLGLGVLGGVARRRASSASSHSLRGNPPA